MIFHMFHHIFLWIFPWKNSLPEVWWDETRLHDLSMAVTTGFSTQKGVDFLVTNNWRDALADYTVTLFVDVYIYITLYNMIYMYIYIYIQIFPEKSSSP